MMSILRGGGLRLRGIVSKVRSTWISPHLGFVCVARVRGVVVETLGRETYIAG